MFAPFLTRIDRPIILGCAFSFFVAASFHAQTADAESWTDLRGTRTISARMVGLWGDNVLLELGNGRRVSVNLNSLRSDSRIQARRLAKELTAQRAIRIAELNQASIAAAASAPDPLPKPDEAPAYQPPSKDVEVDTFLNQVDQAIAAGHLRAVYDSLPPSYRSDVDELVRLAAAKVDADGYQLIVGALQAAGSALVTHQNWLLSSPRVQAVPESTVSQIRGPLLSLAGLAHATKDTDLFDLDKIRSEPFSQWLGEFDTATCDYLYQTNQELGRSAKRDVEVGSTRERDEIKTTHVKIGSGESESSFTFTKVDGYWVPTSMDQENWSKMVNEWKDKIDQSSGDSLLQPYAGYAQGFNLLLGPLTMAENSNDFHAAIETTAEFLTTNLPPLAALFGVKWDFNPDDRQNNGYYEDIDY
ncbi:hypothetical protein LF1_51110 [Rubripirellula obstinata]|uniref:SLA1 homology domain-containing protein n=1 Tax=Rubripirellula obstinata TaxID=406547 RepID=A0A5B1CRF0_9BACT|nr:hypothetical protein [Rubripirellula obstinata]KAA1262545.1 hypothetical protein LF1_51110 [Rubripirellula obstinata]